MGSYNCIGFLSRLPVRPGDDITLFLGLHVTPQKMAKYAFDPVEFAPGLDFTPIALPIMCKYDDGRMVRDVERDGNVEAMELFFGRGIDEILTYCDYDYYENDVTIELEKTVNEKLGLEAGEYKLTYTFDHRFVYDEVVKMKLWWDYEKSYELTKELSDTSAGCEIHKVPESSRLLMEQMDNLESEADKEIVCRLLNEKHYAMEFDIEFKKRCEGLYETVGNLNPKYTGSSIFQDCESCRGTLLLSIYRYHSDILFRPDQKTSLLGFLQFYQVLRYHGWMMTLPIYGGQDDKLTLMAPLYRRMVEWVDNDK
ncbi:MAG: hypothetical protein IKB85_01485 [Bacteroidales bacterium]|nr:hypothetical protein [Bacteroidales bacterium]